MQVLIINGFEDSKRGSAKYNLFHSAVKEIVKSATDGKISGSINYICRNINELSEYTCDWMHDSLTQENQYNTKLFDKLDIIFVSGDMTTLPWAPKAMQLVKLLHMANQTEKCVCSIGMGAFSLLYSTATSGCTFNILNGPHGGTIDDLPNFRQYGLSDVKRQKYPSGFLDNETGDIYTYNVNRKAWVPVCNTGIFKIATTGKPSRNTLQSPSKKLASTNHVLSDQIHLDVDPEAIESNQIIVSIVTKYLQNFSVKKIQNQNFVAGVLPTWHVHRTSTLPAGYGLEVIAEGEKSSHMLLKDNKLLLFMDETSKDTETKKVVRLILTNFIEEMVERMSFERIDLSLTQLLFGGRTGFVSTKKADTSRLNGYWLASPVRTAAVSSSGAKGVAEDGPVLVDTPDFDSLFDFSKTTKVNYYALQPESKRLSTTEGRPVPNVTRSADSNHMSRLEGLLKRSGSNVPKLMAVKEAVFEGRRVEDETRARMETLARDQEQNINNSSSNNDVNKTRASFFSTKSCDNDDDDGNNNEVEEEEESPPAKTAEDDAYVFSSSGKRYVAGRRSSPSAVVHTQPQLKDINKPLGGGGLSGPAVKEGVECRQASFLLPHFHPQPHLHPGVSLRAKEAAKGSKAKGSKARAGSPDPRFLKKVPAAEPALPEELPRNAVYMPLSHNDAVQRPYSSYKRLERARGLRQAQEEADYKGVFTETYMSDFERQVREYAETRRHFVSEKPFLRHFGKRSAVPLREEGQIAGQGAYPAPPQAPALVSHLPAKDWFMLRSEDKGRRVDPAKTWIV